MLKIWFGPVGTTLVINFADLYYQFRWYLKFDQPIGTYCLPSKRFYPKSHQIKLLESGDLDKEVSSNNDIDLQTSKVF